MIEEFLEEVSPHFINLDHVAAYDTVMKYVDRGITHEELSDAWSCLWNAFPQDTIEAGDTRYSDLYEEIMELIYEPQDAPESIFHPDYERMITYTLEGETDGAVPDEIEKELKSCEVKNENGRNRFTSTFKYDPFAIDGVIGWAEALLEEKDAVSYRLSLTKQPTEPSSQRRHLKRRPASVNVC